MSWPILSSQLYGSLLCSWIRRCVRRVEFVMSRTIFNLEYYFYQYILLDNQCLPRLSVISTDITITICDLTVNAVYSHVDDLILDKSAMYETSKSRSNSMQLLCTNIARLIDCNFSRSPNNQPRITSSYASMRIRRISLPFGLNPVVITHRIVGMCSLSIYITTQS